MTLSSGSASYGNHIAAATAEVVSAGGSAAKISVSYPASARTTPHVRPETPAPMIATRGFMLLEACRIAAGQLDYNRGRIIGKIADGQSAGGRTGFAGGSARALSAAAIGTGTARECPSRFGEGKKLRRPRARDRDLHHRSQHQLHECLQRLLQILRVLPDGKRRGPLRPEPRTTRPETRRTFRGRRGSNPDAGRAPSEVAVRLVSRFASAYPRKISAHQHSRVQSAGAPTFRRVVRNAVAGFDFAIQGSRARLRPRWVRREPGG